MKKIAILLLLTLPVFASHEPPKLVYRTLDKMLKQFAAEARRNS